MAKGKGKRIRPKSEEEKIKTLSFAFALLEEGQKRDTIERLLAMIPDMTPYKQGSFTVTYSKWKKGELPEINLMPKEETVKLIETYSPKGVHDDSSSLDAQTPEIEVDDLSSRDDQTTEMESEGDTERIEFAYTESEDVKDEESSFDAQTTVTEELKAEFETIARRIFEEMMKEPELKRMVHHEPIEGEFPPAPKEIPSGSRGGRPGTTRKYVRTTVSIDENLWRAFEKERDRLRLGTGRMLDICIWRALGKPKLSYEDEAQESLQLEGGENPEDA